MFRVHIASAAVMSLAAGTRPAAVAAVAAAAAAGTAEVCSRLYCDRVTYRHILPLREHRSLRLLGCSATSCKCAVRLSEQLLLHSIEL